MCIIFVKINGYQLMNNQTQKEKKFYIDNNKSSHG